MSSSHQPALFFLLLSPSLLTSVISVQVTRYYQGGSCNLPFLPHRKLPIPPPPSFFLPFFSPDLHHLLSTLVDSTLKYIKSVPFHPVQEVLHMLKFSKGNQYSAGNVSVCHSFSALVHPFALQILLKHLFNECCWLGFTKKCTSLVILKRVRERERENSRVWDRKIE